jgi:hypothetical protein
MHETDDKTSSLDRACRQTRDKVFLERQIEDDNRNHGECRHGEDISPVGPVVGLMQKSQSELGPNWDLY